MTLQQRERIGSIIRSVVVIAIALICAVPLYVIVINTFKSSAEMSMDPIGLPKTWNFENYTYAFGHLPIVNAFKNTIIVMTSNAGSATKEGTVGFGRSVNEQDADRAMKALQQFLRPEFINRVDAVITFNRLSKENFKEIAKIMLGELVTSLGDKGIAFTYDDSLVEFLVEKSFSRTYGARNLRRTIQKELEDPMATKIIDSYEHPITQVKATVEDGAIRLYTL